MSFRVQQVASQRTDALAYALGRLLGRLELADRRKVLVAFVAGTWLVTILLALRSLPHDGWFFPASGSDQTSGFASALALTHLTTPAPVVSYGMPVLLAPFALLSGGNLLAALPALIVVEAGLLGALGVLGVFAIAERLGGRLFACATTLVWVLVPVATLHFFGYPWVRPTFVARVLPSLLGLTMLGAYPSMVLAIVVVWLLMRAIEGRRSDAVLAGVLCGFMVGIETANGFLVPVALLALVAARRPRDAASFALALVPGLALITLWTATGSDLHAALHDPLGHFTSFSWSNFSLNLIWFRKDGWSERITEWLLVAGICGLLRRGPVPALLIGGWALVYLVAEGGSSGVSVRYMTYFTDTMPGFPAFVLAAASIVFLLPGLGRRWAPATARAVSRRLPWRLSLAAAALVAYPLVLISLAGGKAGDRVALLPSGELVPVEQTLDLTAVGGGLRWRSSGGGEATLGYELLRGSGALCASPAARECALATSSARRLGVATATSGSLAPGAYRVGILLPEGAGSPRALVAVSGPVQISG